MVEAQRVRYLQSYPMIDQVDEDTIVPLLDLAADGIYIIHRN